jgi:hypothetical protein
VKQMLEYLFNSLPNRPSNGTLKQSGSYIPPTRATHCYLNQATIPKHSGLFFSPCPVLEEGEFAKIVFF